MARTTKKSRKVRIEEEEGDEGIAKSVVPRKYRKRYQPHRNTCGDAFADRLRQYLVNGDGKIDRRKLNRLAKANKCPTYASSNVGLARMSIGIRLRAMERRGETLVFPR